MYFCHSKICPNKIVYFVEWSLGAEFWSGILEWSGVKFWSSKSTCSLLIKPCILWSGVLERSIGVESDFRVTKVEWSAIVMCVCVAKFYLLSYNSDGSVTLTSQLHSILLLPLQNLTPLCSKTPLHRLHGAKNLR